LRFWQTESKNVTPALHSYGCNKKDTIMSAQLPIRSFLSAAVLLFGVLPLAAQICPGPSPCSLPPGALALSSSSTTAVYGSSFSITATLQSPQGGATPTGAVQFYDGSIPIAAPVGLVSNGAAAVAVLRIPYILFLPGIVFIPEDAPEGVLAAGSHTISASYSGDGSYLPLQPGIIVLNQTITKAATTTTLVDATPTVSISPPSLVRFAFVTGSGFAGLQNGNPTGVMQVWSGGSPISMLPLTPVGGEPPGGDASHTVPLLSIGGVGLVYPGDSNYFGSMSPGTFLLAPAASVAISAAPVAPIAGQPVTLTAIVSTSNGTTAPTGSVQFFDKGASIGTSPLTGGQAQLTTTNLNAGLHSLSATYSGDSMFPSAPSSYLNLVVSKPSVSLTLTSKPMNAVSGQSITLTGTLSPSQDSPGLPAPSGSIQFYSQCVCGEFGISNTQSLLGTAIVSNSSATLTVTSLPAGASQIFANYSGDANWSPAASNLVTTMIGKAVSTTTWVSLATDLKQITLTAKLSAAPPGSGTPTGTVQFIDSTTNTILASAALSAGGKATATIAAQSSALVDPIAAVYSGDSNFAASTASPVSLITVADSAGYGTSVVAPDEEVSAFGSGLATGVLSADASHPPTSLGGVSVMVQDAAGASRLAFLLLVSPTQANIVIPAGTAPGPAIITVNTGSTLLSRPILISNVAPGLFAANGRGSGFAAAQVIYEHSDGTQEVESIANFDAASQQWVGKPIQLGSEPAYLILYGTGIRHWSSNAGVTASINGLTLPAAFAGAQSQFPGLDQVDVLLPANLAGSGQVSVTVTADGLTSNAVSLLLD
jgi:uncharacterized protein (TIGR03437 family)